MFFNYQHAYAFMRSTVPASFVSWDRFFFSLGFGSLSGAKMKKKKLFSLRCTKCTVTISDRILNYTIPVLWGLASRETVMLHLWEYNHSLWWKANARNVSFIISFRWLIHVINSVDQTRLSCNTCFMSMTKVIFPFFWSCFFSTCRYNWVGKSVFEMPGTGKCQRQWS